MEEHSHEGPLDRPVFVMGTGRCGLTPLMQLIAYHPDFAWPSNYHKRFPRRYPVALLSRLVDLPVLRGRLKFASYFPKHDESYPMWNHLFYGFAKPIRDLVAEDVSPLTLRRFERAVTDIAKWQGKRRFVAEYSGWSRIDFFKAIFPGAKFIHIVRDGRAVANSLTHVEWWQGWEGVYKWRWGIPEPDLLEKLRQYDHSFVALAGIHWTLLIRNIVAKSRMLPARDFHLVRYEDLVANPRETARACIRFAGLDDDSPRFLKHLDSVEIVNANESQLRIPSWKSNLTPAQIDMLNDICGESLEFFGYPIGSDHPASEIAEVGSRFVHRSKARALK
ncbi:MAG TPA: sulfotransferase [Vicinamibacteria bacterium]|nr:sulfotransferase [Vicinamibacteria bacterium]